MSGRGSGRNVLPAAGYAGWSVWFAQNVLVKFWNVRVIDYI